MVRSVERYPSETIVVVHAKLRKAPKRIKNATVHDYELEVYEVHKVSNLTENVPFTVYDAENINRDKEEGEEEGDDTEDTPSDTPRQSGDWSRISSDQALSRSKSVQDVFLPLLTICRQLGRAQKITTIATPKSTTEQPNHRPSNWPRSIHFPNTIWDL